MAVEMSTKAGTPKPRVTLVTDVETIQAIKRNDLFDPIGAEIGGQWFAYAWSIELWRKRAQASAPGSRP